MCIGGVRVEAPGGPLPLPVVPSTRVAFARRWLHAGLVSDVVEQLPGPERLALLVPCEPPQDSVQLRAAASTSGSDAYVAIVSRPLLGRLLRSVCDQPGDLAEEPALTDRLSPAVLWVGLARLELATP